MYFMRKWYIPTEKPQKIGVLVYPQFSNHCLANAVEPLRAANTLARKKLYDWQFLSIDGAPVQSSSGLPILPDETLARSAGGDYLFVLPSYDFLVHSTPETHRGLRSAARRFDTLVGMDTGSWLLAAAGLLDGRRATIHWDELAHFAETFPAVRTVEDRFVIDGTRITCGGAMTAFDLVLDLIGQAHGESLRLEVAALFMHGDRARPPNAARRSSGSDLVDAAVAIMRTHIEAPLPLPEVAAMCATSQRSLEALFHRHLGTAPRTVYKRLRLLAARRYAEQSEYSVAEIALRCGYRNASAMTRAFTAEFGVTPRHVRQASPAAAPRRPS